MTGCKTGMDAHLAKPFAPEDLARMLRRFVLGDGADMPPDKP